MTSQIRVLAIDDSEPNLRQIEIAILRNLNSSEVILDIGRDVAEAILFLKEYHYDLLLIDLNLPFRKGEAPRRGGGQRVLQEIERRPDHLHVPREVLAITDLSDLAVEQHDALLSSGWAVVDRSNKSFDWEENIEQKAYHAIQSKRAEQENSRVSGGVEFCAVTALGAPELTYLQRALSPCERFKIEGDPSIYYRATIGAKKIVFACSDQMGVACAAAQATKMISRFRPSVIAMTGIAAGYQGEFGDIRVAVSSWDYGSGKIREDDEGGGYFSPRPRYLAADPRAISVYQYMEVFESSILDRMYSAWDGLKPARPPVVRRGPMATGASVIANRDVMDRIRERDDGLIAVEMEAYGVFGAARWTMSPPPAAIVIKSICDFGDSTKSDEYQEYAAYTSAQYFAAFCRCWLANQG